ncbi:MAG TPA: calcium-binding protein [Acidobacteriota bacterium]|nr:calcium-binding protein [Acidobacteriota bacterium]
MARVRKGKAAKGIRRAADEARLDELIEEAIVDCYNESEQITGFLTMLEEHLALPFSTIILGTEVTVERIDITDDEVIVATCRRGRDRQWISVLDLPLPRPRPVGSEWIDAYRKWSRWSQRNDQYAEE